MVVEKPEWKDVFLHLLALASKLEGEGQYNLGSSKFTSLDDPSLTALKRLLCVSLRF